MGRLTPTLATTGSAPYPLRTTSSPPFRRWRRPRPASSRWASRRSSLRAGSSTPGPPAGSRRERRSAPRKAAPMADEELPVDAERLRDVGRVGGIAEPDRRGDGEDRERGPPGRGPLRGLGGGAAAARRVRVTDAQAEGPGGRRRNRDRSGADDREGVRRGQAGRGPGAFRQDWPSTWQKPYEKPVVARGHAATTPAFTEALATEMDGVPARTCTGAVRERTTSETATVFAASPEQVTWSPRRPGHSAVRKPLR